VCEVRLAHHYSRTNHDDNFHDEHGGASHKHTRNNVSAGQLVRFLR
jgi:hypothetical protein